ncbi:MAG: carbon-nitrogen hydrolase family protein [Thermoprotei archaeon]
MKLGIVQAGSVQSALQLTERALKGGARVVLLPKDWTVSIDLVPVSEFQKLAKLFTAHVVIGAVFDGVSIVSPIITPDGNVVGLSKKIYVSDKSVLPGTELVAFKSMGNKFGILIDDDLLYSELVLAYLKSNVDVVLVPSSVPASTLDWWKGLLKARAIETRMTFVNANLFVPPKGGGRSSIAEPTVASGKSDAALIEILGEEEGYAVIEVDTNRTLQLRALRMSEYREVGVRFLDDQSR